MGISISLTLTNRAAREKEYIFQENTNASFASRTMIYSGFIILAFLIFHLLHFTFGMINPEFYGKVDNLKRFNVHLMLVNNFSDKYISLAYIGSLLCLGLHLSHAFFSVCQTFSIINTHSAIHKARKFSLI